MHKKNIALIVTIVMFTGIICYGLVKQNLDQTDILFVEILAGTVFLITLIRDIRTLTKHKDIFLLNLSNLALSILLIALYTHFVIVNKFTLLFPLIIFVKSIIEVIRHIHIDDIENNKGKR